MTSEKYTVKTPVFEGPLELLLDLVEKRKLFVSDISLAEVTDDYIEYVRNLPAFSLGNRTAFIVVAATLLLVKSRSLLPNLALTEDEDKEIGDLEERLRLYGIFKDASGAIKRAFGERIIFERTFKEDQTPVWSPDPALTKESMHEAIRRVIAGMPKKEAPPVAEVKKVISIEEMIDSLAARIERAINLNFSEFSKSSPYETHTREHRVFVIVGFLAMLELIRNGVMDALQSDEFGDIAIERREAHEGDADAAGGSPDAAAGSDGENAPGDSGL